MPNAQEATVPDEHTSTESTESAETTVSFDGEFDEERAKRLIANLKADKAKQAERLAALEKAQREREEAEKTEIQKALERAERAEKALAEREAERERNKALKAALKAHGLDEDDAELLDGVPADKLEARAEALAKRLGKSKKDTEDAVPGKPQVRLAPGHKTEGKPKFDPAEIAERIRNRGY